MAKRKKATIEYRYYEMPTSMPVLALLGERWKQNYGGLDYLHFHNYLEIGYCYAGIGNLVINECTYRFGRDMFSVIPKNLPHTTDSDPNNISEWEYLFIDTETFLSDVFKEDKWMQESLSSHIDSDAIFMHREENEEMNRLILEIISEMRNRAEYYQESVKGLILTLLVQVARVHSKAVKNAKMDNRSSLEIRNALDYISDFYMRPMKINELSLMCHMSETHFRRVFKTSMLMSPLLYINLVRIRMACYFLRTSNDSVLSIAMKTGFVSITTFNRNFMSVTGKTPLQWRNDPEHTEKNLKEYNINIAEGWL